MPSSVFNGATIIMRIRSSSWFFGSHGGLFRDKGHDVIGIEVNPTN